jgi:hypothetical protein
VVLGVLLLASIAFLGYTMASVRRPRAPAAKGGQETAKSKSGGPVTELVAAPADAAFGRYEAMVKRDIFSPPAPPKVQPAGGSGLPPMPNPQPAGGGSSTPPTPRVDVSGWTYVGYIVMGGVTYGVLQNDANGTAQEVAVGGDFLGAKVQKVTSEEITLSSGGAPITLTVPRDFPVTPLSRAAGPTASRPRPQTPAAGPPGPPPPAAE